MSARLVIDPAGPASEELSEQAITAALEKSEVTFGIDKEQVQEILQKWRSHKRHYEFERVAKGVQPESGREGSFHMKVRYLASIAELEVVQKSKYHWEAFEKLGKLQRIAPDMVVAEKLFDVPPMPGSNVKGEPLITSRSSNQRSPLPTA